MIIKYEPMKEEAMGKIASALDAIGLDVMDVRISVAARKEKKPDGDRIGHTVMFTIEAVKQELEASLWKL